MTRSAQRRQAVHALGAAPVVATRSIPSGGRAVAEAEPEVIVHELTALSGAIDMRHFDRDFALTNRLRTEGTDHLLAAGARPWACGGSWPELRRLAVRAQRRPGQDRGRPARPGARRRRCARTLDAIRHLEEAVTGARLDRGHRAALRRLLRAGDLDGARRRAPRADPQAPLPGRRRRGGVWSFVHIEDAAEATVAAVEHGRRGIYNIVDDEPAPVAEWLPAAARTFGAKPPRRVPARARAAARRRGRGGHDDRRAGASNAKAKRELGWRPATRAGARASRAGRVSRVAGPSARRAAPVRLRDRLPDARQRGGGGGRRPGVAAARAPRARATGERIESPRAYMATIATRLAIDQLRSARVRRETLRRRVAARAARHRARDDPARQAEMADSLSLAFLVLLESLSPEQRAALLLHDVFDYGYDEIAAIVGKSEDNARQLAARARRHVERAAGPASRPRASSATSWPPLLRRGARRRSRRPRDAARRTTSCCTATAAARCRRWPDRCTVAIGSRARCATGRARARGWPGGAFAR